MPDTIDTNSSLLDTSNGVVSKLPFVGKSDAIKNNLYMVEMISKSEFSEYSVFITGEPGTGKSLMANYIHTMSSRKAGPFVTIDFASVSSGTALSELFGHQKGSFTGAINDHSGLVRIADGGTLHLDNIEKAPLDIQMALLRVTERHVIMPIGSNKAVPVSVRWIASTAADPESLVNEGVLRGDLFYRLSVVSIDMPPLRDRKEDIPLLAEFFLSKLRRVINKPKLRFSDDVLQKLTDYKFPGNVRELKSIIESAAILSKRNIISPEQLRLKRDVRPEIRTEIERPSSQVRALNTELEHVKSTSIPAKPIWEGKYFPIEQDLCFVLMPFTEENDVQQTYSDHVKKVVEEQCGLRCERADDIYDINGIMQSVWESINKSRILIAEMTGRNPNVFYELGIAHTIGKPVIMITQSMEFVPFDLKHLRCIVYKYKPQEIVSFEKALYKTIKNVIEMTTSSFKQELEQ